MPKPNTLNKVAGGYNKQIKSQWDLNKKGTKDFAKGAQESGSLVAPGVMDKLKKAWTGITK
jgi:hypothetical protein